MDDKVLITKLWFFMEIGVTDHLAFYDSDNPIILTTLAFTWKNEIAICDFDIKSMETSCVVVVI